MNYKGNAFSAGTGSVCDAVEKNGRIYFLQAKGAGFDLRAFDLGKNSFENLESAVSLADSCRFFGGGLLELFGTRLGVVTLEGSVLTTLS